ncbi:MAG: DUF58 domain-containing protein [Myxococcales bacterium]|nr:DUF58 domain-containing protein [Myxococcales bacterium]
MSDENLFSDEFLKKLEILYIISRKIASGQMRAERRTKKIGSGIEFADHRNYVPGDDFRNLDWMIYARTRKLLLRLFEEEEDLYIYLLVDCSESMSLEGPSGLTKFQYAKMLAAALAYIGLSNLDRVAVVPFNAKLTGRLPPSRGRGQIHKIFKFLGPLESGGQTDIKEAFRTFVTQNKRRGIATVISDFYDPQGFQEGLNFLRYQKFEPIVMQVYDEAELNPALRGDLQLVDCETGAIRDVTVTAALLERYREAFFEYCDELEEFCVKRRLLYFRAPVQEPFDELVLRVFRAGGFLK